MQCMLLHGKCEDGSETTIDDEATSGNRKKNVLFLEPLQVELRWKPYLMTRFSE